MRAAIVYNPNAGRLPAERQAQWAAQALRDCGWEASVRPTPAPGQMHALAAAVAAEGVDAIFAAGGDGTVGAVAEVLAGKRATLGVLPIGTANLWAMELGLAGRMNSAQAVRACVETQLNGIVRAIDIGMAADTGGPDRKFLLWAGLGLDAHIISKVEPRPEAAKRLGALYYSIAAFAAALDVRGVPLTIRVGAETVSGRMLLAVIANIQLYAGLNSVATPDARADDGILEVMVVKGDSALSGLAHLIRFRMGRHLNHPNVKFLRGPEVEIESERPLPLQCDGEFVGQVTRLRARVCPSQLHVFAPRNADLKIFERRL
jgi:YegS/Rv2252/BmrU family lipid kinase